MCGAADEDGDEDESAHLTTGEKVEFWMENFMSSNVLNKFYLLLSITLVLITVHAAFFTWAGGSDWRTATYYMVQTIATGSYDSAFEDHFLRLVYISAILCGIIVFTVLVGFMNELIMSLMFHMSEGKSKIACADHTLLLGWNESTVRCVCQLALLRRAYLKQNETFMKRICPWRRVKPSTPLAAGKIVIMCNTKSKEEMDQLLRDALLERGISPKRTKVGTDVICRVGDPTEPHFLLKVGAHLATAVLTMMTEEDELEKEGSGGVIHNGMTLKTILALKSVIFKHRRPDDTDFWDKFRCVLHLEAYSPTIAAATFHSPTSGHPVVHALDLRSLVNSMMFSSAINNSLPHVMLELLNFDGCAFRARDAADMGLVGMNVLDCALMWEDAVFCGVVDKHVELHETEPNFNEGLACNPDRLITENDRVIFIGESSFPKRSKSRSHPRFLGHVARPPKRHLDTLVCGWRKQWEDGNRLAHRVIMLVEGTMPGSNIVFLNMKEDFAEIISSAKENGQAHFQKKGANHWEIHGVRIFHILGDPGDAEKLHYVMENKNQQLWKGDQFEVVIVMGTSAKTLPKKSQDIRMLSTHVLVHKIHKEVFSDAPLHVIGENQFDSTAALAFAVTWKDSKKDLVNTQAMFARGLVQALAFPLMQPAIAQMFYDAPRGPGLKMFPVGMSMIPVGRATFGDITRTITEHVEMAGAIVLGVVSGENMNLAPSPDEEINLKEGDLIPVIERGAGVVSRGAARRKRIWVPTGAKEEKITSCCINDEVESSEEDDEEISYEGSEGYQPLFLK